MTKRTPKFNDGVNHLRTTPLAGLAQKHSQLREILVNFERHRLWGGTWTDPALVDYAMMQGDIQLENPTALRDEDCDAMLQFLHSDQVSWPTHADQWYN